VEHQPMLVLGRAGEDLAAGGDDLVLETVSWKPPTANDIDSSEQPATAPPSDV